jgi:hypothetical protein
VLSFIQQETASLAQRNTSSQAFSGVSRRSVKLDRNMAISVVALQPACMYAVSLDQAASSVEKSRIPFCLTLEHCSQRERAGAR